MEWQAVQRMKEPFRQQILEQAAHFTGIPSSQLRLGAGGVWSCKEGAAIQPCITYEQLGKEQPVVVNTHFHFPTTPDAVNGGHFLYSFGAVAVRVEVDLLTGKVKVVDMEHAVAAGPVVSPLGYLGQIEGGGVMALGYTLMEEALMSESSYVTENLDSYLIPGICDVPFKMEVEAIETLDEGDPYGPRGVGEIGTIAVAPAIAKAIHDAVGCWISRLPVSAEMVVKAAGLKEMKLWR